MDAFFDLLGDYGPWLYALLFLYCAGKSGALPLFAGFAAQQGSLDPYLVALISFLGGYLGDELRFWWARRYGIEVVARRPKLAALSQKACALLDRYGGWYIFVYRYPKGLRTIGALPVGLGSMPWRRFTLLNAGSAMVWASVLVGTGYLLGEAVADAIIGNWAAMSIALLAVFALASIWMYGRMKRASRDQDLSGEAGSVSASGSEASSASRSASAFSAAQAPAASTATGEAVGRTLR